MVKKLQLLVFCVGIVSPSIIGMDTNDNKLNSSCMALAMPSMDVISYCLSRHAAKEQLLQNPYALHQACKEGNLNKIQLLLSVGAYLNARDDKAETPLHKAAQWGRTVVVNFLLQSGAAFDMTNTAGNTPLQLASIMKHKEIINLLLNKGAFVNNRNDRGSTPMYTSVATGNKELANLFINHGANLYNQDNNGNTVFHIAELKRQDTMLDILISAYFPRAVEYQPAHSASTTLQELCVETLLKNLDSYDKESLRNYIIPAIAYDLNIHPSHNSMLRSIIHQAPLKLQRNLVTRWRQKKSPDNVDKLRHFLETHYARHFANLKDILELENNMRKTAAQLNMTADEYGNPYNSSQVFRKIGSCHQFSDLDDTLQHLIKKTIETTLGVNDDSTYFLT